MKKFFVGITIAILVFGWVGYKIWNHNSFNYWNLVNLQNEEIAELVFKYDSGHTFVRNFQKGDYIYTTPSHGDSAINVQVKFKSGRILASDPIYVESGYEMRIFLEPKMVKLEYDKMIGYGP